jgi:hypothetical protein
MVPLPQSSDRLTPAISNIVETTQVMERKAGKYFKIAVLASLAFFFVSHMTAYKVTNQVYKLFSSGTQLIEENGMPSLKGNLIHSGIFFIIMLVIVYR